MSIRLSYFLLLIGLYRQVTCCQFANLDSGPDVNYDIQPKQKKMLASTGTIGSPWTFDEMMQVMAKLRTVWASPTAAYREWSSIHGDIECYKLHPTQPTGLVCNSTEFSDYVSDKY